MNLGTFILQNLHVAIVIAILLLGLVVRRAGVRKPPQAPMPPFGGAGMANRRAPNGREAASSPDRSTASSAGSGLPTAGRSLSAAETPMSAMPRAAVAGRTESSGLARTAGVSPEVTIEPDREELIRAVIWSEVLGPPRAKRPYRPK